MAEPVEVAIEYALLTKAQAFASSQSPSLAISLPNIAFTPPTASATAKWLRATFLPAPTSTLPVGSGSDRYYGLLQVDVFYGQGAGELAPARLASAAITFFAKGTEVVKDGFTTRVYRRPSRGPMIKDDPWMMIPVTINFECFATA
jgi:hypothetical protein